MSASKKLLVALEIGKKRTFASAVDWPGWARAGRDEGSALQALYVSAPRYARVLQEAPLDFQEPSDTSTFQVTERLEGSATTDFGAPDMALSSDSAPLDDAEVRRFRTLLEAYWKAFDAAVGSAVGNELRKGPRGGGRDLDGIIQHVLDADEGYLRMVGWKLEKNDKEDQDARVDRTRRAILDALMAKAHGELPERGPRGGVRWSARYFARRLAWHVLDHAWEIEDRIVD